MSGKIASDLFMGFYETFYSMPNLTSLDIRNFHVYPDSGHHEAIFRSTKLGATIYVKDEYTKNFFKSYYPSGNFVITG